MNPDTITAPVQTVEKGLSSSRSDLLVVEEPLQFCLNGFPLSITMRSPGSDLDLATGFLFTEGIIDDVSQILSMSAESAEDGSENSSDRVTIRLKPVVAIDPGRILAVEVAQRFGMTLVGFLRGQRFNIYSGDWRIE